PWPGLSRPRLRCNLRRAEGVDGRDKPGQGGSGRCATRAVYNRCLFPGQPCVRGAGEGDPACQGWWVRVLVQPLAGNRDAVQQAAFAVIIVDGEMPGRAVVPERERPFPPLETAGELGPHRVAVEIIEQRARLVLGPAIESHGKPRIDVKRLAA